MRTIGKRHPRSNPRGDYRARCDECRAPELRSKLIRRADGLLYHRQGDCQPSLTATELSRLNAERATARRKFPPIDGGNR